MPLARRIEDRVPVATCLPGAPGTVTTFGLSGWTYCRWLPTVRSNVQPFARRTFLDLTDGLRHVGERISATGDYGEGGIRTRDGV
jgi:hypothetical protein